MDVQYVPECQVVNQPVCSAEPCQTNGCSNGGTVCSSSEFSPQTVCAQGGVTGRREGCQQVGPAPGLDICNVCCGGGDAGLLWKPRQLRLRPAMLLQRTAAGLPPGGAQDPSRPQCHHTRRQLGGEVRGQRGGAAGVRDCDRHPQPHRQQTGLQQHPGGGVLQLHHPHISSGEYRPRQTSLTAALTRSWRTRRKTSRL